MTADVVAFLRAALDEVERVALDAAEVHGDDWNGERWPGWVMTPRESGHLMVNDPRAALARVQAERALLDVHIRDGQTCIRCEMIEPELHPCETLRWLAYGHRHTVPGFDPAWAPEGVSVDA